MGTLEKTKKKILFVVTLLLIIVMICITWQISRSLEQHPLPFSGVLRESNNDFFYNCFSKSRRDLLMKGDALICQLVYSGNLTSKVFLQVGFRSPSNKDIWLYPENHEWNLTESYIQTWENKHLEENGDYTFFIYIFLPKTVLSKSEILPVYTQADVIEWRSLLIAVLALSLSIAVTMYHLRELWYGHERKENKININCNGLAKKQQTKAPTALEILNQKYVKGQIKRKNYLKIKRDLKR